MQAPAVINSMARTDIAMVREIERRQALLPQISVATVHLIHAGMYARTITMPAGTVLTSALIKIPTVMIVSGDVTVTTGDGELRITGYQVVAANAGRKQVFVAHADTDITMIFPTSPKGIAEIEREFTDESELLFSRNGINIIHNTGEPS